MYNYNFTKEKMHKVMYLLEDKTACFHEKTKAISSMIKQKQINNTFFFHVLLHAGALQDRFRGQWSTFVLGKRWCSLFENEVLLVRGWSGH